MAGRKPKHRRFRKTVAIVTEGKTEVNYFMELKQFSQNKGLNIEATLGEKSRSGFQPVFARARNLAADEGQYHAVFALIDLDKIFDEKTVKDYETGQGNLPDKVRVIESFPCFELWLLLHFKETSRHFKDCKQANKELKNCSGMANYDKSNIGKYIQALEQNRPDAIERAKNIYEQWEQNGQPANKQARTNIHQLFEELEKLT